MSSHKIERIASDLIKYLSNILLVETDDELMKSVTLTDAEVTNDLSYAKVYFTAISELSHKELEKEMNEAAPFLRGKLAKVLEVRNIPELKFIYDESIEYGNKIEKIITKIHENQRNIWKILLLLLIKKKTILVEM